jgi:hypothetical protein
MYATGDITQPVTRDLVARVLDLEDKRFDVTARLDLLRADLDRCESRGIATSEYCSLRLGTLATELDQLRQRIDRLEKEGPTDAAQENHRPAARCHPRQGGQGGG